MTWREFENGYWYLGQLKDFAERIGIPAAKKLRKDELEKYIVLNKMPRFERVPHDRYINFVADFLDAEDAATRAEAIAAWKVLKKLDVPKNYVSWVKARANRKGKNR